jgi:hypothetical protein
VRNNTPLSPKIGHSWLDEGLLTLATLATLWKRVVGNVRLIGRSTVDHATESYSNTSDDKRKHKILASD